MKNFIAVFPLAVLSPFILSQVANAADNMADCEAVMVEQVMEDGEPTGAVMQTFAPAVDVLTTIYDDEDGFLEEIDGRKVKAILCQRSSVIPTLRDFPILATGIPFAISTDFEAADSRSVTMFYKDGEFQQVFKGTELPDDEQAELDDAIEVFNLQSHDLPAKTKGKDNKKDIKAIDEDMPEDDVLEDDGLEEKDMKTSEDETDELEPITEDIDTTETLEVSEDEGLDMEDPETVSEDRSEDIDDAVETARDAMETDDD